MRPKILFVEDQVCLARIICDYLQRESDVLLARCVREANMVLEHEEDIACIMVDLNMPVEGLPIDQIGRTRNGLLTGWVWLESQVFVKRPHLMSKTIVYSAFLDELRSSFDLSSYGSVKFIDKRNMGRGAAIC